MKAHVGRLQAEARAVLDPPPPPEPPPAPAALLTGPVLGEDLVAAAPRVGDPPPAEPPPPREETPAPERAYWTIPEAIAWVRRHG